MRQLLFSKLLLLSRGPSDTHTNERTTPEHAALEEEEAAADDGGKVRERDIVAAAAEHSYAMHTHTHSGVRRSERVE